MSWDVAVQLVDDDVAGLVLSLLDHDYLVETFVAVQYQL